MFLLKVKIGKKGNGRKKLKVDASLGNRGSFGDRGLSPGFLLYESTWNIRAFKVEGGK